MSADPAMAAPAAPGPSRARESCPYQGLVPFREEDAELFFGRDEERALLRANLLAARLTVVYGASGVGKTSVLRAGLLHDLRAEHETQRAAGQQPEFLVVAFASWRDDPILALEARVEEEARAAAGGAAISLPAAGSLPLAAFLGAAIDATGQDLLVVLDQFEDLFLYHAGETSPGSFVHEFAKAVNSGDLRANFIVALREDSVARLDVFKGRIPGVLRNTLRIQHLSAAGARAAITGPLAYWNRHHGDDPVEIEPVLVEGAIEQVRTGRVLVGEPGRGGVPAPGVTLRSTLGTTSPEARIEAPYLQLVLERIWAEEAGEGSQVLRRATLERLGGAEAIVREHLRVALGKLSTAEQNLAAEVFRYLVTPSGGKIALSLADLSGYLDRGPAELASVLSRLEASEARILRQVPASPGEPPENVRYEIFHDVLGKSIAAWRVWYDKQRLSARAEERIQRERRRVRQMKIFVAALGLLVVGLALTVGLALVESSRANEARAVALRESSRANDARAVADLRALAESALVNLDADPQLGLLLAIRGASDPRAASVPELAGVLRRATAQSRALRPWIDVRARIMTMAYHPARELVAVAQEEGIVTVWSATTGEELAEHRVEPVSEVRALGFDRSGALLVAGSDDGQVRVWEATGSGPPRLQNSKSQGGSSAIEGVAFSPREATGSSFATGDARGRIRMWALDGSPPREVGAAPGQTAEVTHLAFSDDGAWIATSHMDGAIRIWAADPTGPRGPPGCPAPCELRDPTVRVDHVNGLAVSNDGRKIASANWDHQLRVYDLDAPADRRVRVVGRHANTVFAVAFSPDGRRIASASADGSAVIWSVGTRARLASFLGHSQPVCCVAFAQDGNRLLTASWDGTVRTWDARGHAEHVTAVAAAARAPRLATGGRDGTVKIWDLETGAELAGGDWHRSLVSGLEFSQDGTRLATKGDDGVVNVVETSTGNKLFTSRFVGELTGMSLSWDGKCLAEGSDEGPAWFWEIGRNDSRRVEPLAPEQQMKVRFTQEGKLLAYTDGGWARTYSCTPTGCTSVQNEAVSLAEKTVIMDAAFSAQGILATAGLDGRLRFHDGATLKTIYESEQYLQGLTSVVFSGDGKRVAYAGWDRMVRVMDVASRKVILTVPYPQGLETVALGAEGRWLAVISSTQGGLPDLYPVNDEAALAAAREHVVRTLTKAECERYLPGLPCAPPAFPGGVARNSP